MEVPNIEGLSLSEAEKTIRKLGLDFSINNDSEELDKENLIVTEQLPKEGICVNKGSKVYVKY